MHVSCIVFAAAKLPREEVEGKSIIDVGSYDYNGNLYSLLKHYSPAKFVGVDMLPGPGVDLVCSGEDVVEKFGKETFDLVVSTELLEHARNWRAVISNLKQVCKLDGTILITTRSKGFALHAYPHDYWRYEVEDMREIFSDCEILALEPDPQSPGVFLKVHKPRSFKENNLDHIALYSMIEGKRVVKIDEKAEEEFIRRCNKREFWLKTFRSLELSLLHIGRYLIFGKRT